MDTTAQSKFERLEAHVSHLEKQYDELNAVIIEQNRELARLRLQVRRLTTTLEGLELDRIKATNPRPPHSSV